MNNEMVQKEDLGLKKHFTSQEMREKIVPSFTTGFEPEEILKKLSKEISKVVNENGVAGKDKDSQKLLQDASMILGLDNHHLLISGMKGDYRPLAIEFANNLNKEYDCKTASEKALSQTVVNAYIRLLDDTCRFNICIEAGEYLSENRTKHLAMLSKQIDRANRQFISALTALKQFKSPQIQINVRTQNAFLAQNQQLNANNNLNETITP